MAFFSMFDFIFFAPLGQIQTPAAANAALTIATASSWIFFRCASSIKLSAYTL